MHDMIMFWKFNMGVLGVDSHPDWNITEMHEMDSIKKKSITGRAYSQNARKDRVCIFHGCRPLSPPPQPAGHRALAAADPDLKFGIRPPKQLPGHATAGRFLMLD